MFTGRIKISEARAYPKKLPFQVSSPNLNPDLTFYENSDPISVDAST
jgi:hypothetical protein